MKVLYIINGIGFASNVSLGGSDKRALEIGRRLLARGHKISVLTTESGWQLFKDVLNVEYFIIKRPAFLGEGARNTRMGRVMAYCYACAMSNRFVFKDRFDIVFPTSDFFFDLLPAISAKVRGKARAMVSIVHHKISNPWHRQGQIFFNIGIFLLQRFSFLLMGIFSDRVFIYATREGEKIRRVLSALGCRNIRSVLCGIDLEKIKGIGQQQEKFTACFVGGLRPAKGLWDIVPIWEAVCRKNPSSRLLIVGGGLSQYVEGLRREIEGAGLIQNITLLTGHLEEAQLYESIRSSRLLILPSYEEGWSIIICEALSLGVPAVVYDLDVFSIFSHAVIRARLGDKNDFAAKIIELMSDEERYARMKAAALALGQGFDWAVAAGVDERWLLEMAA